MQAPTLYRDNALSPEALRRIVREVGFATAPNTAIRSLVVIVQRNGHLRMASWSSAHLSRLDLGLAEARAYRAWSLAAAEDDPLAISAPLPADLGGRPGLVRFELSRPADEYVRTKIGLAVLRLTIAISAADASDFGDGPLHAEVPGVAVLDDRGEVQHANAVFSELACGADSLDALGTMRSDSAALRRVLDDALRADGEAREIESRIGLTARPLVVRCAMPLPGVVLAVLAEREPFAPPAPRRTNLPMVNVDRATLRATETNSRGRAILGDASLVSILSPEDRLPLIRASVAIGSEPQWIGPFSLGDGSRVELAAVSARRASIPCVSMLIAPAA